MGNVHTPNVSARAIAPGVASQLAERIAARHLGASSSSVAAATRGGADAAAVAGVARPECPTLVTAPRLIAATRDEFRAAALDLLDRATAASASVAVVDMGQTVDMDASGLGILVLLHKRAKERGIATRLLHTPEHVRRLLTLTKLEYLFEYAERAA
ncbi:MAG TPA: STAS domain-containing protein [Gemmatimonadaceae bacterium]|nr:STAS domain-containing protein [Gemmatimonadaceae bacterium]